MSRQCSSVCSCFAFVALFFSAAHPVSAQTALYTVTDLGTLGGFTSWANSLNNRGDVVGEAPVRPVYDIHAFLYRDGAMRDLDTQDRASTATGINDRGQVVGYSSHSLDDHGLFVPHAFLWTQETGLKDLGTLGGLSSFAYAINDRGEIVGNADTDDPNYELHPRAFVWDSAHGMRDLGTLNGGWSSATDINENGQIVGSSDAIAPNGNSTAHAFLYEDGVMRDLGVLPGFVGSYSQSINAKGQIVGQLVSNRSFPVRTFLYSDGVMQDIGALPGFDEIIPGDINDQGQVVGTALTRDGYAHAYFYAGGMLTDMNSLIAPDSGWLLTHANSINAAGQIAGIGTHNGADHAIVLTPLVVPEPTPCAWLGGMMACSMSLASWRWHSRRRIACLFRCD
jgi:probable HAF family extracellular repeat protein